MTFDDLVEVYEKKKKVFGSETYKYVSQIFKEIRELHRQDTLKQGKDVGQKM